jgi:peptidoglycan/xylan/chitin deacetylase (PgdA/CDA1 family)
MKAVTFSYDDGVTQDIRLAELFHKYGLKATFNLNSNTLGKERILEGNGWSVQHNKVDPADVSRVYAGHEVAGHTLTHPLLTKLSDADVIRETEDDRLRLSDICGYEVVGFAYPGGGVNYDRRVSEIIKNNTGYRYCRTTVCNHSFLPQTELYEFKPTVYHHAEWDNLFKYGEKFLSESCEGKKIYYVWGHAYEFDIHNTWDRFEEFLRMMAGRADIEYLTNKEALLDD